MSDQRTDTIAASDAPSPVTVDRRAGERRRDPFAHGELPQRPNFLPEEEDKDGNRSEYWNFAKALIIGIVVIVGMGWLLTVR